MRRVAVALVAVLVANLQLLSAQAEGRAAFEAYRAKLKADGLSEARVGRTLSLIAAYDKGKEHDKASARSRSAWCALSRKSLRHRP